MNRRKFLTGTTLVGVGGVAATLGIGRIGRAAPDPAQVGSWSVRFKTARKVVLIHQIMLMNGAILAFGRNVTALLIRVNGTSFNFTDVPRVPFQPFCSGHTHAADGRPIVFGGHKATIDGDQKGVGTRDGIKQVLMFNQGAGHFDAYPDMAGERWYPTATVLETKEIVVMSGWITQREGINTETEVLDVTNRTWRTLTGADNPPAYDPDDNKYPTLFPVLDGEGTIFKAGPSRSWWLNTRGVGSLTEGPTHTAKGAGVMYAPGEILLTGGRGDEPLRFLETINLRDDSPHWRSAGLMNAPRGDHNVVMLPNGKVLIIGGNSLTGRDPRGAVAFPELWDPLTGTISMLAHKPGINEDQLLYHSTAMLLPDGRVLTGGGGEPPYKGPGRRDWIEIYSPPYLHHGGSRPRITGNPRRIRFGGEFTIQTPEAERILRVTLRRLPAVTHGFDHSQGFVDLDFTQGTGELNVSSPLVNEIPPGPYYLSILDDRGVPGVSRIVLVS